MGKYSKLFKPFVEQENVSADEALDFFNDKVPEGDEWQALKDMGIDINLPSAWHEVSAPELAEYVLPFVTPHEKDWGNWYDDERRTIPNNVWHDFGNHKGSFSAEDFEQHKISPEARRSIFRDLAHAARMNQKNLSRYGSDDYLNYGDGMRLSIEDALKHKEFLDSLDAAQDTQHNIVGAIKKDKFL